MAAYYNENDAFAAAWLRNLIDAGRLPAGDVDERSIVDVRPGDLAGYAQCHFFAGIGGWAYALRLAGWPPDRPVWTGSCPCQPFSSAGRQGGALDERHLWPQWFRLIRECRPHTIFGEQVEGAVGFGWVDRVFADLEAQNYACGAEILGAHSVGAPHSRPRIWWVADTRSQSVSRFIEKGVSLRRTTSEASAEPSNGGLSSWLFDCTNPDTVESIDGVRRPVGEVRAFGNAIVPQAAAEFIKAFMDIDL